MDRRDSFKLHILFHVFWCPGNTWSQGINNHGNNTVLQEYSIFSTRGININDKSYLIQSNSIQSKAVSSAVCKHYNDIIVSASASQITIFTIVYSTIYSGVDQRKHQSSASLVFVRGIHRWPVNSLHKGPIMENVSIWWRHHDLMGCVANKCHSQYMNIYWKKLCMSKMLHSPFFSVSPRGSSGLAGGLDCGPMARGGLGPCCWGPGRGPMGPGGPLLGRWSSHLLKWLIPIGPPGKNTRNCLNIPVNHSIAVYRWYPAKRALPAMLTHGR